MARAKRKASRRGNGSGSIYRRNGRGPWIGAWTTHSGKQRAKSTRTGDRAAALRILAKWTADEALRIAGVIDPRQDDYAAHHRKPLAVHLESFRTDLAARGNSAQHIRETFTLAESILTATAAKRIGEIDADRVRAKVNDWRTIEGKSLARCNHALRACKAFTRWAYRTRRAPVDALAGLSLYNAATDRRRVRRALSADELRRLIVAAETGPDMRGMSGATRAALYRIAAGTGYRAGELASLTPESFNLDDDPPTIAVEAGSSKRRRRDVQPIRADLADWLAKWLADKPKRARLFTCGMSRTGEALRRDLRRARVAWRRESANWRERRERRASAFLRPVDDAGRCVDFHSLRHGYITALVKGGASAKQAQQLARHSTPVLTLNCYTALGITDTVGALDALPSLDGGSEREAAAMKATGTDGPNRTYSNGDSSGIAKHGESLQTIAANRGERAKDESHKNPLKIGGERTIVQNNATHCRSGGMADAADSKSVAR